MVLNRFSIAYFLKSLSPFFVVGFVFSSLAHGDCVKSFQLENQNTEIKSVSFNVDKGVLTLKGSGGMSDLVLKCGKFSAKSRSLGKWQVKKDFLLSDLVLMSDSGSAEIRDDSERPSRTLIHESEFGEHIEIMDSLAPASPHVSVTCYDNGFIQFSILKAGSNETTVFSGGKEELCAAKAAPSMAIDVNNIKLQTFGTYPPIEPLVPTDDGKK